jgi:hypothetical protein
VPNRGLAGTRLVVPIASLPAQPRTARAATYTWSVNTPIVAMVRCVLMLAFTRPPGSERCADELSRRFLF